MVRMVTRDIDHGLWDQSMAPLHMSPRMPAALGVSDDEVVHRCIDAVAHTRIAHNHQSGGYPVPGLPITPERVDRRSSRARPTATQRLGADCQKRCVQRSDR